MRTELLPPLPEGVLDESRGEVVYAADDGQSARSWWEFARWSRKHPGHDEGEERNTSRDKEGRVHRRGG